MSVFYTKEDAARRGIELDWANTVRDEQQCFYCYKPFTEGVGVLWMGSTGYIYLHHDCALRLLVRLMSDVHACEVLQANPTGRLRHRRLERDVTLHAHQEQH